MNTIIVLLAAVASLLANPKVQSNPVLLAQVETMSQTANALVEEYTAVQAENNPSSTYNNPPSYSGTIGSAMVGSQELGSGSNENTDIPSTQSELQSLESQYEQEVQNANAVQQRISLENCSTLSLQGGIQGLVDEEQGYNCSGLEQELNGYLQQESSLQTQIQSISGGTNNW